MTTDLSEVNRVFGTDFRCGDEVIADNGGHKIPTHGMIAGAEEDSLNLRLVRHNENRIYPAEFYPGNCYKL